MTANAAAPSSPAGFLKLPALLAALLPIAPACAGDWPQILGPHRDGLAEDEPAIRTFPDDGPPILWEHPVGRGFAGPAVAKGTLYLFHRVGDVERLEALDAATGEVRWTVEDPATYGGGIVPDDGPRCVPTVIRGAIVTLGAAGMLRCREPATGAERWSHDLAAEYGASPGYFGFGSSPLIAPGVVICEAGGKRAGAGVVGFDMNTGRECWTAVSDDASYSSPVFVTADGTPVAVCVTRLNCVGLEPRTGRVRWSFPFGSRGPTATGANPVTLGDGRLFLTASYGVGAALADVTADSAETRYTREDRLAAQYTTPVRSFPDPRTPVLYGVDGRQDVGAADLVCFDPVSRRDRWRVPDFGYATLIGTGDSLLILKTDGTLVLAENNPEEYVERGRATLFKSTTRALPALSNGVLYARDENSLQAFRLASP